MKTVCLLLVLALAGAQGRSLQQVSQDAELGHKPKTPEYTVVSRNGSTEIREYANATWAASFGRSSWGILFASHNAAKGLFDYYTGANNLHEKIQPATPILTALAGPPPHPHGPPHKPPHGPPHKPPHGPPHKPPHRPPHPPPPPPPPAVVVAGFLTNNKTDVPRPDSHHVKIVHTNSTKVYTHKFGGWAIEFVIKREIRHLSGDLKSFGLKPWHGKFLIATYDSPLKVFDRTNEVWWVPLPRPPHHHHHHNDSDIEEPFMGDDLDDDSLMEDFKDPESFGLEALDAEHLFRDEFPKPEIDEELEDEADGFEDEEGWSTVEGSELNNAIMRDAEMDVDDFIAFSSSQVPQAA